MVTRAESVVGGFRRDRAEDRELRECAPRLRWDAILSDFPHLWEIHDMRANVAVLKEKLSVRG